MFSVNGRIWLVFRSDSILLRKQQFSLLLSICNFPSCRRWERLLFVWDSHFWKALICLRFRFRDLWVSPSTPWSMILPRALLLPGKTRPWIYWVCILWILYFFPELRSPSGTGTKWRQWQRRQRRRRRANNRHATQPPASKPTQGPNIPFGGYPLTLILYTIIPWSRILSQMFLFCHKKMLFENFNHPVV